MQVIASGARTGFKVLSAVSDCGRFRPGRLGIGGYIVARSYQLKGFVDGFRGLRGIDVETTR
jgi:hypothetical protein